MQSVRYITRMDYARTRGWWVRVWRGATEPIISKMFSDGVHDGKQNAFRAAVRFRNQHATTQQIQRVRRMPLAHSRAWRAKKSKLPLGISRTAYLKKQTKNGQSYWYPRDVIAAYYSFKGKQIRKEWNLATHDLDDAIDHAVAFRRRGLKRIYQATGKL